MKQNKTSSRGLFTKAFPLKFVIGLNYSHTLPSSELCNLLLSAGVSWHCCTWGQELRAHADT